MNQETVVAPTGVNRKVGMLKFLPLLVLVLIWLWILLIVTVLGLNTSEFHSLFGWTAMVPHLHIYGI